MTASCSHNPAKYLQSMSVGIPFYLLTSSARWPERLCAASKLPVMPNGGLLLTGAVWSCAVSMHTFSGEESAE